MTIQDKVIMITGASRGLGKALTIAFANDSTKLAICARNKDQLQNVKQQAENYGASVLAIQADMSNIKDVERFVAISEETYGSIDVLINNASILGPSPMPLLLDYPEEDFLKVLTNNAYNPFLVTRRVLPNMLQHNKGVVLNITSEAGHVGYAGWGAYGISKFALEGLTQTWADELKGTNIRVNMVDPGEMDTEMHAKAVPDCDYELNDPNRVANLILYLSSEDASHINGKRISANEYFTKGIY